MHTPCSEQTKSTFHSQIYMKFEFWGQTILMKQSVAVYNFNLRYPDTKVHGANMGPNWVLSVPDGPHVGPMNLAIRVDIVLVWNITNLSSILLLLLKVEYSEIIRSIIPQLLMSRLPLLPDHPHPQQWLLIINGCLSSRSKDFKLLNHNTFRRDENAHFFYVSHKKSAQQGLMVFQIPCLDTFYSS